MGKPSVARRSSAGSCLTPEPSRTRRANADAPDAAGTTTTADAVEEVGTTRRKRRPLSFAEQNPFSPESVILLHIIFSCGLEWKQVCPKLPSYHLLIPDLPAHSGSRDVCRREEFSLELCADHVADLIREHAHDGRAHLVGISTGGFVALELVRKYPHVVRSAFVSGAWPTHTKVASYPRLTYSALWTILHSPGYMFFKASGLSGEYQNDELLREIKSNASSRLMKAASLLGWKEERMREVGRAGVRLCLVAGGTGLDNTDEAQQAAAWVQAERDGGEVAGVECCLFLVRDAIHAWNLQLPLLFAKGVESWIERRPMPAEFEKML